METERAIFFRYPQLNVRRFLLPQEEVMMFGNHMTFSRSLYEKASLNLPMTFDIKINHIGKTSFDLSMKLLDDSTGDEFVTTSRRIVNVNMETKQPALLPETMKESLVQEGLLGDISEPKFEHFGPLSPPKEYFRHKLIVRHDNMDCLFHTNQAVYTRFAENCAAAATQAGFYKHFKDDICFYLVKKSSVVHVGESFAGDELEVATWQDENDHNTVFFLITRAGKDICYERFVYFPSP
jgi:acyl-CoA thioesterase FadM